MIDLQRITARYGSAGMLDDVSLSVAPGMLVAVVGARGAARSCLLRVASGRERPLAGRVLVDGEDLTGRPPYVLRAHGVRHVARRRCVYPRLTVRENVYVQAAGADVEDALDAAVLTFPELGSVLDRPAGSLPDGQRQMLALCDVAATECGYVLLDELLDDVMPDHFADVAGLLERLVRDGCGVLVTAGEQAGAIAGELADRVHTIDHCLFREPDGFGDFLESFSVSGHGL
ncbi:MAG TPA: ATP-binding cassette domain-containing protein [Amycolatopsis sp.]|nr:ATP-binding cassette domain-containing protein [Amycolatopsis sp.]